MATAPVSRLTRCVLLAVWVVVSSAAFSHAADWCHWRGPHHNGVSDETGWVDTLPGKEPPIAWTASVGTGFSSLSVCDGRLFTMGNKDDADRVSCLDATTGKRQWSHCYECPLDDKLFEGGPTATPTVDEGYVYTLSRRGHLFCFNAASGAIRWSKNIQQETGAPVPGWGFAGSPLVHGELLVLTVGEAGTAVSKASGKLVWTTAGKEAGYASPVPIARDGRTYAIIPSGRYFHAVDIETGREWWRHRWLTRLGCNAADPLVTGDRIFISSGYNRGAALLKLSDAEPTVVWSNKDMRNQFSSSVLIAGFLYGIDGDTARSRTLKCMALETGDVKWTEESIGPGSLTAADGKLIILSERGELIIAEASPSGFRALSRAAVLSERCWTVPVLANGMVYCRGAEGNLVCVDLRPRAEAANIP